MRNRFITSIRDEIDFGMHKGESLFDVLLFHPDYIYWCINNIEEIHFSLDAIKEIRECLPDFIMPIAFECHISEFDNSLVETDYYEDNIYDDEFYIQDDEPSYGRYAGTWAQDYGGYSDDDIDTIFDGEPDAYWNID